MRWIGRRESSNVEDRRGSAPRRVVGGSIGTLVILALVYLLGGNPDQFTGILNQGGDSSTSNEYQATPEEEEMAHFVAVVLADTEDAWDRLFQQSKMTYRKPKLVLYSESVESACGMSSAATGPFYCPADEKVYIDLSFLKEMQTRFQAQGDFAAAYVIAHEVGHHVQKLLGTTEKVMALHGELDEKEFNKYLVRLELQADFFAGVWAHHAQKLNNILEEGDLEEALNAATAVGDDRIQKSTRGYVVPDAFTHGTSAQRRGWFEKGFKTGDVNQGNTFETDVL